MAGQPVTIRLLDPPLHEFLPHQESELAEVAQALGVQPGQQWLVMTACMAQRIAQQRENQCGLVDLALAEFQAGHQQGIL